LHYSHAVTWQIGGHIVNLGTLGGPSSSISNANSAGVVAGSAQTASGETHAVLWENGKIVDLHELIKSQLPQGVIAQTAKQITDSGRIEVSAVNPAQLDPLSGTSAGQYYYLLTPVISTTVTLVSTVNPSSYGQPIKLRAQVIPESGSAPTGMVTFKDGATVLGTASVGSDRVAGFTTTALSAGSHMITATFGGDSKDASATSTVFTQTVGMSSTATTVKSSANPATHGKAFALIATVTPAFGAIGGTVTFKSGAATLGVAKLESSSKQAAITTTLNAGRYAITAVYSGTSNFSVSQSAALSLTVR
jgi:probable HAF family extracellular repeat protein